MAKAKSSKKKSKVVSFEAPMPSISSGDSQYLARVYLDVSRAQARQLKVGQRIRADVTGNVVSIDKNGGGRDDEKYSATIEATRVDMIMDDSELTELLDADEF